MSHKSYKKVVLFASGAGSNVQKICEHFKKHPKIRVEHLYCNNPKALVLEKAKTFAIEYTLFNKTDLTTKNKVLESLVKREPDLIVLAGFLLKMPKKIIEKFPRQIINIHPALLPKFGGKGMYGKNIHRAVIEHRELKSGISIHYVNENYDEGTNICQKETTIDENETPESLAKKVLKMEHESFSKIIEKLLSHGK